MKKKELNRENLALHMMISEYERKIEKMSADYQKNIVRLEKIIENQRAHLARLQWLYDNGEQSRAHTNKVKRLKDSINQKDAEINRLKEELSSITPLKKTPEVMIYQNKLELEFRELESANFEIKKLKQTNEILRNHIGELNSWVDLLIEMGARNSLSGNVFSGWSEAVNSVKKWCEENWGA
jgi:uncharacterized protein YacL (UPF0231 family)